MKQRIEGNDLLRNWEYELNNEGYYQIYLGGHEIMKVKCSYELMLDVVSKVNQTLINAYKKGELKLKVGKK